MPQRQTRVIAVLVGAFATIVFLTSCERVDLRRMPEGETQTSTAKPLPELSDIPQPTLPDLTAPQRASAVSSIRFSDVTEGTGIDFRYFGSPSPEHYMTEQNGGGVALFDIDGDGHLDMFFANGSHFRNPAKEPGQSNRMFREIGTLQYADVTELAGLQAYGFGMGCAAGDYNNDGFVDLYVAAFGRDRLWQNNGDGTFNEVTDEAGIDNERWGTSAAFCDLDGDGNLDLYVVNYVDWSPDEQPCFSSGDVPVQIVCSPNGRPGQRDVLFRNLGQQQFEEVGATAGIAIDGDGKGLAVAIADLNADRRPDIYVANDTTRNFLFLNTGNMTFREVGVALGVSNSDTGDVGAGMGVSCADINRDGRLDLGVTNFRHQVDDIFLSIGDSGFIASNAELGVDRVSRMKLGFGILLQDFDLDGWADLFVATGHIWDLSPSNQQSTDQMLPTVMRNDLGRDFVDVGLTAGEYSTTKHSGRAAAAGDLDNDGDVDVVVAQLVECAAILRNDSFHSGKSLRLRLIGRNACRQQLGTRVEVDYGQQHQVVVVPSGQSFQASHDDRLCVAVGNRSTVDRVTVYWSDGQIESWYDLPTMVDLSVVQSSSGVARETP